MENNKQVILLHNPKAGDEEHSRENLIRMIEEQGFVCHYSSMKNDNWTNLDPDADFLVVAGGDGTVRDTAKVLLEMQSEKRLPIALLPSGTANNIATSLQLMDDHQRLIESWIKCPTKKIDTGIIKGINTVHFFLESFGYGVLSRLMQEMEKQDEQTVDLPEKKMNVAIRILHEITLSYAPQTCKVIVDGKDYSGTYLMVEVLNMSYIGPNLNMDPLSDPGDGEFEITLISPEMREAFAEHVLRQGKNLTEGAFIRPLRGRNIQLKWGGKDAHVDDEIINDMISEVSITVNHKALQFFT